MKKRLLLIIATLGIAFIAFLVIREFSLKIEPPTQESIKSLKYLSWTSAGEDISKRGTTIYNPALSYKGVNIYSDDLISTAYLVDMSGKILHQWISKNKFYRTKWHHVEMDEHGGLFVIDFLDWF